jgi:DNA-binding response OmpR family regulator
VHGDRKPQALLTIDDELIRKTLETNTLGPLRVARAFVSKSSELAKKEKPDLVLCDVMMPELDGYGVIVALRANAETDSIPFILVTTKADQRDFCTAMSLGADDYLTKPVAKPDLLGAICSCLERAVPREALHQR